MLVRLFIYPILLLCLWNLAPIGAGYCHDDTAQESIQQKLSTGAPLSKSLPNSHDCNNESCPNHVCHFGHCQILTPDSKLAFPSFSIESFHINEPQALNSIDFSPIPRPPHFSFHSA
ncbi:MAG: hypothetical protein H7A32_04700 [Deltaproteobacteria bacterium]|nr:hypothetical protein [Deltaproteobacteria bacterium]